MKRTTNILLLTLTLSFLLTGCGKHHGVEETTPTASESFPIRFGISGDLEVESKAGIDNSNVTDFSFRAFGNLTVKGVQQTDLFESYGATVYYEENIAAWTYSPLRYWQPGSYNFAAVMPSLTVYTPSFSADNQLTLNFGDEGFDLSERQADLMVAFDEVTVDRTSQAGPVNFTFEHQLALLNIEVQIDDSPMDIAVDNIKIYGNHKVATAATFTTRDDSTITASWTLRSTTTEAEFYHQVKSNKIENLLVFPETGSNKLTVAVTYKETYGTSTFSKTKYGEIEINWKAGKIYTYKTSLTSESIVFGEPTVTEWSNGGAADNIPQM